jgi:hypothetical protein
VDVPPEAAPAFAKALLPSARPVALAVPEPVWVATTSESPPFRAVELARAVPVVELALASATEFVPSAVAVASE